jgi:hypothetical protein
MGFLEVSQYYRGCFKKNLVFVSCSLSVFQNLCPVCGIGETKLVFPLQNRFTNTDFRQCITEMFSLQHGSWRYISKVNKRNHYTILPTKTCNKLSCSFCFIAAHFPAASRHSYFPLVHRVNMSLRDQAASFSLGARGSLNGPGSNLTTRRDAARRSRMLWITPPLPHTSSLRGAFLCWGQFHIPWHHTNTGVTECLHWTEKGIQFEQIADCFKLKCDKSNQQYFFIDSKLAHR